jgi:hypothetical protein
VSGLEVEVANAQERCVYETCEGDELKSSDDYRIEDAEKELAESEVTSAKLRETYFQEIFKVLTELRTSQTHEKTFSAANKENKAHLEAAAKRFEDYMSGLGARLRRSGELYIF